MKFQTYISEKRYDEKTNPKAKLFIKIYQIGSLPESKIKNYGNTLKKGAQIFTSPFDIDSLNFAEKVGSIAYKIAAFEINNHELISEICKTGKPIFISRGMYSSRNG